jgi:hypothetical protein
MKNKALLNCLSKEVILTYNNQEFLVDLSEGDLHDSWNGITLENGTVKYFNFSWEDAVGNEFDEKPSIWLYEVLEDGYTNHSNYDIIDVEIIEGTKKDYFKDFKIIESQEFGAVKVKFCMIDFEGMLEEGVELISQDYIFKDIELVGGELSGVNSENIDKIININV